MLRFAQHDTLAFCSLLLAGDRNWIRARLGEKCKSGGKRNAEGRGSANVVQFNMLQYSAYTTIVVLLPHMIHFSFAATLTGHNPCS